MSYHYGSNPSPRYIPTTYNSLREAGMSYPPNNNQPQQGPPNYGMVASAGVPSYPSTPYTSNGGQWPPQNPATSNSDYERYMANAGMVSPYARAPQGQPYTPSPSAPHPANPGGVKQCHHCGTMTTPLWRRDPSTQETLCNACGLYLQQRREHRPQMLIDADREAQYDSLYNDHQGGGGGPECNHCHTRETSVWRRDKEGNQVCNACGVYQRLRGVPRPLELKRGKPKPRAKHSHS